MKANPSQMRVVAVVDLSQHEVKIHETGQVFGEFPVDASVDLDQRIQLLNRQNRCSIQRFRSDRGDRSKGSLGLTPNFWMKEKKCL